LTELSSGFSFSSFLLGSFLLCNMCTTIDAHNKYKTLQDDDRKLPNELNGFVFIDSHFL
jgi:hypothetical protein